jgi:small subunit ribosomal protein S2
MIALKRSLGRPFAFHVFHGNKLRISGPCYFSDLSKANEDVGIVADPNAPCPSESSHAMVYRRAQDLEVSDLIKAGLHLGHYRSRWKPLNLPYILGERHGLHVIDVTQTLAHLRRAANFVQLTASYGGLILFVASKPELHGIIADAATHGHGYYVPKWLPGTLTNAKDVLRQEVIEEGIVRPDIVIALDTSINATQRAILEATKCNIPTIAPIDTDVDPRLVTYGIPANDDGIQGLKLITGVLSQAAKDGYQHYEQSRVRKQINRAYFDDTNESKGDLEGWADFRHV